ncbi:MAG: glycosyltransferase [Melioribacteraceae bacterium]|nr:glycosyltransferase [Melioribacteraceae bacterium]
MKHDYGDENRGLSYEYINIHQPLVELFGERNVINYDFMKILRGENRDELNEDIKKFIDSESPGIVLFCLFEDEFDAGTIDYISSVSNTICYFFDDPWRQSYVRKWINHFSFFSTPDYYMYLKYIHEGIQNALYSPFGFNSSIYKKKNLEYKYDVSFVGGYSAYRKWVIKYLAKAGIKVHTFGRGWDTDKSWITNEEMVNIFNQSRINLNLSNGIYYDYNYLFNSFKSPKAIKQILLNKKNKEQVKGRHFEINGCGGFQLSYFVPGLNKVYLIDEEIAVYEDIRNLADEINFFLENDSLREEIALKGYERSMKDHTSQKYLSELIKKVTG